MAVNTDPNRYRAEPCPCGHPVCKNWLVWPVAAVQGVSFTETQARFVAAVLNLAAINGEKILSTDWLTNALGAMAKSDRETVWRPIATAPESGFGRPRRRYVLVRGDSGMRGVDKFVTLAYHDAEYRPNNPWRDVANNALTDHGWVPEEWAEVPK